MRSAAVLALVAAAALAQGKSPLTFDAVLVKPKDLPRNVRAVEGIHCISPEAKAYFETPAMKDILKTLAPEVAGRVREELLDEFPVPKRKECQSFRAQGREAGSVFVYEYEEEVPEMRRFLESYMHGEGRSREHPEEIIADGKFIWVLSFPFPPGDPAAEWYKDRLRKKFRVPAFRDHSNLASLEQQIVKTFDAKDAATGVRLLQQNAKAVSDWSFGQNMLGRFAAMKDDHVLAEKAFRKALQLHESLKDPLDASLIWGTIEGLGLALHGQGKWAEAAKLFQRAIDVAASQKEGVAGEEARSHYDLACAYAKMKKNQEALDSLWSAMSLDRSLATRAETDENFAELRKLAEFPRMLERMKTQKAPPLAFDAVVVKPEELPENVRAIPGVHTNTPHPAAFFETPSVEGVASILPPELKGMIPKEYLESFPKPKRKECQSFEADGGEKGTVFVFEYETDDLSIVTSFLEPILWGEGGPSEEHPEEVITHGRMLWVIAFPRGDPAAEWYKDRLRKKLRVPAPRERPEFDELGEKFAGLMESRDIGGALRLLRENAKAIEDWSFGQCMVGKLSEFMREYEAAEKGYRKALSLHENLTDPLERHFVWMALDGLGTVLVVQNKFEEGARMFERAIAAAAEAADAEAAAQSSYNIACALAMMKEYGPALEGLEQAISIDPEYKDRARADPAFDEARKRKEFEELLK